MIITVVPLPEDSVVVPGVGPGTNEVTGDPGVTVTTSTGSPVNGVRIVVPGIEPVTVSRE